MCSAIGMPLVKPGVQSLGKEFGAFRATEKYKIIFYIFIAVYVTCTTHIEMVKSLIFWVFDANFGLLSLAAPLSLVPAVR